MGSHRFDGLSFVFGLIFILLGATYLVPFRPFGVVSSLITGMRWAWPVLIIGIGVAVLLTALRQPERSSAEAESFEDLDEENGDEPSLDEALEELPPPLV